MEALLSNHGTFGKSYSTKTFTPLYLLVIQLTNPTYAIITLPEVIFRPSVITNCSMPLLECPISSTARAIREFCVMGFHTSSCPPGTHYGCGEVAIYGYLTEGCFTRNVCKPGTSNRIVLDIRRNLTNLECVPCDDNHYQPLPADSLNDDLKGCSMERKSFTMKQQSDHMILVHTGWPTRPDIYSCNYAQGFSDALENMYCDVTTPCACTNNIFCLDRESPELLPDGSCDGRCAVIRDMERNYSCLSYESEEIWDEELGEELKKLILVIIFISSVCFFCFSYFLARRRYRKKEVKGSSRRGSLVPLERVTKRRVSFCPENEFTKFDSGIKALELEIPTVIEADEEDEEVENVESNVGNDNAVSKESVDKQSLRVDTREGEVPRLKALQDPPKWYLSVPEDEERSIERVSIDKYSDTDREPVREEKQQKFFTVEEIPNNIKINNRITDGNRDVGCIDEYEIPFAKTFPSIHQKYQYLLNIKKRIEETTVETGWMEKVGKCNCKNQASEDTTTPTIIKFLVRGTAKFDPLRLMVNATNTNIGTKMNKVERKEISTGVSVETKQSSQVRGVKDGQYNNLDGKNDNYLKDYGPTSSINNINISDSVVELSNDSDTLIRQGSNTRSTHDKNDTSTRFNCLSHMNVDCKDDNRHREQINNTNDLMAPVVRVNSADKPTIIEDTSKGFQYKHFVDSLCNSVIASVQLVIVEIRDSSRIPVKDIVQHVNSFRNLTQEKFETSMLVICDVLQHIGEFRSLQLDVVDALTENFGISYTFEKNINVGFKGHNISGTVSAIIEKRISRAFQGLQSILQDISTTTENEYEHRKTQTLVQEIDRYLRQNPNGKEDAVKQY